MSDVLKRVSKFRTICEVLRELHDSQVSEEQRELILEAIGMAKRMDAKLQEYAYNKREFWQPNLEYKEKKR